MLFASGSVNIDTGIIQQYSLRLRRIIVNKRQFGWEKYRNNRYTDKQRGRLNNWHADTFTYCLLTDVLLIDWRTDWWTDWLTAWLTDELIHLVTDRATDCLINQSFSSWYSRCVLLRSEEFNFLKVAYVSPPKLSPCCFQWAIGRTLTQQDVCGLPTHEEIQDTQQNLFVKLKGKMGVRWGFNWSLRCRWGRFSWSMAEVSLPIIIYYWGGEGERGFCKWSHGFQWGRKGNQSSLTELKGGNYSKLAANED